MFNLSNFLFPKASRKNSLLTDMRELNNNHQTRVNRRSFHVPNLLQVLSWTLERPWSGVKSDVELNMSLQMYATIQLQRDVFIMIR